MAVTDLMGHGAHELHEESVSHDTREHKNLAQAQAAALNSLVDLVTKDDANGQRICCVTEKQLCKLESPCTHMFLHNFVLRNGIQCSWVPQAPTSCPDLRTLSSRAHACFVS